jgi:hypothetical protein
MQDTIFDWFMEKLFLPLGVLFVIVMIVGGAWGLITAYREAVKRWQACLDAGLTPIKVEGVVTCSRDSNLVDPTQARRVRP